MISRIDEAGRLLHGTNQLDKIMTDKGALEHLQQSIDAIYDNFKRHVDVPNVLTENEYHEYIVPLYNREMIDAMEPADMHRYSDKLKERIDDTKPIYIVDNYDKTQILLTLPAIRTRLNSIDNKETDVCATYAHVMHLDHNNRMVVRDQNIHGLKLAREFGKSQSIDKLREVVHETDTLAREVHIKVHGVDIFNPTADVSAQADDSVTTDNDLFGGFEIVED